MSAGINHVTDASWQEDVLDSKIPVVVDFWAPWCGPCHMVAPVLEQLSEEYAGRVAFAKINVDENPDTPSRLGIRGIPTLILYVDGEEADRLVGFAPKPRLESKIDAILAAVE